MSRRWTTTIAFTPAVLLLAAYLRPLWGRMDRHVLGLFGGLDATAQSGILEWTGRHFWQTSIWRDLPIFYPETDALAFMDSLLGQALLVWPCRVFHFATPAPMYNLAMLGSLVLAVAGFALLWRSSGGNLLAAGFGALALVGSPYTLSQLGHLNQLPAAPLLCGLAAILMAIRLTRDHRVGAGRWWWGWGLMLVCQAAWGWYGLTYLALASIMLLAWQFWRAYRAGDANRMARMVVGPALVATAAVALLAQPYLQAASRYEDFERSDDERRYYSADLGHFLNAGAYRRAWIDTPGAEVSKEEDTAEISRTVLNPGWVALVLALVGWWGRSRLTPSQRFDGTSLAGVGILGLVLAFGDSVGIAGTAHRLPLPLGILQELFTPLRALRTVWRFSFLAILAVAWWSAAGYQVLWNLQARPRLGRSLAIGLTVLLLWESWPAALPTVDLAAAYPRQGEEKLGELAPGAVLTLPSVADEYHEDLVEARWLHRSLSHGQPVTGGASGWVPPYSRRLRARLAQRPFPPEDWADLWNELNTVGVRYVEVYTGNDPPARGGSWWYGFLKEQGFTPQPTVPGYTLFIPIKNRPVSEMDDGAG